MSYLNLGIALFSLATLLSWLIVKVRSAEQPKQVKIMLFGLYFWGFVFLELAVYALFYYFQHQ